MKLSRWIFLCWVLTLSVFGVNAAGDAATLELNNPVLTTCENDTLIGSYQLIARDSQGAIVNATTPVNVTGLFITDTGIRYKTDSIPRTSDVIELNLNVASIPFSKLSVYFFITGNRQIRTPVYIIDCATKTITPAKELGYERDDFEDDGRLNRNAGDLVNVLYLHWNRSGLPEIRVYGVDSHSRGYYIGEFNFRDIRRFLDNPPGRNLLLETVGASSLYVLTTGEFQINIGPDAEGKTYTVIFAGLSPDKIYFR